MRKFSYWLCFALVALSSVAIWFARGGGLLGVFSSFGSLVPPMFRAYLPGLVAVLFNLVLLGLVIRRAWLAVVGKEGVPAAFAGLPKGLAYVGTWSFALALALMLLSIVFRAGSGVPAGILLLPAVVCMPWAFFLTEVLTLRGVKRSEV
jgi:hypothetical protein